MEVRVDKLQLHGGVKSFSRTTNCVFRCVDNDELLAESRERQGDRRYRPGFAGADSLTGVTASEPENVATNFFQSVFIVIRDIGVSRAARAAQLCRTKMRNLSDKISSLQVNNSAAFSAARPPLRLFGRVFPCQYWPCEQQASMRTGRRTAQGNFTRSCGMKIDFRSLFRYAAMARAVF